MAPTTVNETRTDGEVEGKHSHTGSALTEVARILDENTSKLELSHISEEPSRAPSTSLPEGTWPHLGPIVDETAGNKHKQEVNLKKKHNESKPSVWGDLRNKEPVAPSPTKKPLSYATICGSNDNYQQAEKQAPDAGSSKSATSKQALISEPSHEDEWDNGKNTSFGPSCITTGRDLNPQRMLQGQGAWKPIEIGNMKAARRAVNNCRVAR